MKRLMKYLLSAAAFLYVVIGLPAVALALLLVAQGETVQGRMFGLAATLAFPLPVLLLLATYLKQRRSLCTASACLFVPALLLLAVCYHMTPNGRELSGASATSVFTGKMSYSRTSIANLVPEIDQLKLGTYIYPRIDPLIDSARAVRIRRLFMNVYREMQQTDEFNRLGSVFNYVYRDMFLGSRPTGHFYQYIPKAKASDAKLPVIIFLHGSLGNFKGYLWVWKRFADEHGYAIVAPSFGTGNWYLNGGTAAIEEARRYCLSNPRMDGNRIYLAGLSNGGTGVSRAVAANGQAYAGFIYISPVMEPDVMSSDRFLAGCKGRRVLVLHGSEDERIPARLIHQSVNHLSQQGVNVKAIFYPDEDHFLIFSKPDQIRDDIAQWAESNLLVPR